MKILITGGCGFVGSNIAVFLKKNMKNVRISSLDNLEREGSKLNEKRLKKINIKNYRIDINNHKKIQELKKFNLIIDCCAEPSVEVSKKNPEKVFKTNLLGTFNILRKCAKEKSNIIFLSSSRVYSIGALRKLVPKLNINKSLNIHKLIDEKFETEPVSSLYGFTKLASEKLIKEIFYNTKLKYIINRFGVIAGPWQFGKEDQGFVPLWVAKHFYKKNLSYIGFGGFGYQVRDIIHINDVCEIILIQIRKLNKTFNETFNIGGGKKNSISLRQLTSKCEKLTSKKIKFKKIKQTSDYDIPYYVTNNRKVIKFYKWQPLNNIDRILKDILSWLIMNKNIKKYFK